MVSRCLNKVEVVLLEDMVMRRNKEEGMDCMLSISTQAIGMILSPFGHVIVNFNSPGPGDHVQWNANDHQRQ